MANNSYSPEELFDENNSVFPDREEEEFYDKLLPEDEVLLLAPDPKVVNDTEKKSQEIKENNKEKKKNEFDDTETLIKEIKQAQRAIKSRYCYQDVSPRLLRSMVYFYQEDALKGKNPGLCCKNNPDTLLIPIIENDGEHEIVVLRSPIIGSLERHQLLQGSKIVEELKEYYAEHNS